MLLSIQWHTERSQKCLDGEFAELYSKNLKKKNVCHNLQKKALKIVYRVGR